jgi:DNA polymerase-3 subunit gamma/tau
VAEEDALGVFGLVSRDALERLAAAILNGDAATILSSIEMFDSAGKNMRRLAGELLQHFRNLVVLQALGPDSKSLEATPDQIKVLEEQAKGIDPDRVFKVCDQLAEMEDKLRYVLSVRTLIEMSLIRASRIASTATIEELMKAVRALKEGGEVALTRRETRPVVPAAVQAKSVNPDPPQAVAPKAEAPKAVTITRSDILNDPKLNAILKEAPGSSVTDIKEVNK